MEVLIFDHMEQCTEAEVQRLLPLVPAWRREQAQKYKYTLDQYCCLKSWTMLQSLLKNEKLHTGSSLSRPVGNPACSFDQVFYNEHGKPFFITPPEGESEGVFFSISHCKHGIAVAVDERPVGIDIESRERRPLFVPEDGTDFFVWWTRMEALVKMRGTGITDSWRETHPELNEEVKTICPEGKNYVYSVAKLKK